MRKIVGISQRLKRAWLDALLDRLVQTTDEKELRAFLDKHLREELPGTESRAKAAGIILRIWSGIDPKHVVLRDRAVALLPRISGQERIWLHWGMTALAYSFFRDLAEVVGRLLALQDDFTTAQVQTRMMTSWGDRATSKEAAQKLVTALVDWEVLRSTKTKGHFLLARKMTTSVTDLQLWLLEALLLANASDEIEAQHLLRLPESFPFTFTANVGDLRKHEGFNIHRQGLDMDMVAIHKLTVAQSPTSRAQGKKPNAAEPVQLSILTEPTEGVVSCDNHTAAVIQTVDDAHEQRRIEDAIKNEVLRTLSDRAARFLQVRTTVVVPDAPFAAPSAECAEQFRDGHYFGCIALTQALLEAVVQHMAQLKIKKNPHKDGGFEKNLDALQKQGFISSAMKIELEQMWADRHSFHHFRPSITSDQQKLEETARKYLKLLQDLEEECFSVAEPC